MTDRELLEVVAKAVGLHHPDGIEWIKNEYGFQWNPLHDDGDALRVAIAMKLPITFGKTDTVFVDGNSGISFDTISPEYATRLAIVRAAAQSAASGEPLTSAELVRMNEAKRGALFGQINMPAAAQK